MNLTEYTNTQTQVVAAVALLPNGSTGSDVKRWIQEHGRTLEGPSINNALDDAVNMGLVEKSPDPSDGRANNYEVTAEGHSLLKEQARLFNLADAAVTMREDA